MANYMATGAAEQPEAELQASALKTQRCSHLLITEETIQPYVQVKTCGHCGVMISYLTTFF